MPNKRAIIVGIDKYEDNRIDLLSGAENDARELYERLHNENIGNFQVLPQHCLIGPNATFTKIRKALNDVFWQPTSPCEIALFYFSGHGFVDDNQVTYIAPYDIRKSEPFVCGLSMHELRSVVFKAKVSSAIIILDSCYSGGGTAFKGDIDPRLVKSNVEFLSSGEGRFVFASSGEGQLSREQIFRHDHDVEHSHGVFTFHLLNALDGCASDSATVSLLDLQNYLDKQFPADNNDDQKQKPKFLVGGSGLSKIILARNPRLFGPEIDKHITTAERCYVRKDMPSVILATKSIMDVLKLNSEHDKARELKQRLETTVTNEVGRCRHWMNVNQGRVRPLIDPTLWDEMRHLVNNLVFEKIYQLQNRQEQLLNLLHDAVSNETPSVVDDFVRDLLLYSSLGNQQESEGRSPSASDASRYGPQFRSGTSTPRR